MVGIVLTAEQVKTAPPAVRDWIEKQMAADFATPHIARPQGRAPVPPDGAPVEVAACTLPEVVQIFERISHDPLTCRVFLAFGQEPVAALHPSPLYALDLREIIAETGITGSNQLVACLNLISGALQVIRANPEATLFAFDHEGRCYVHELTHRALHLLRRDLLAPQRARPAALPAAAITCAPPYRCVADVHAPERETAPLA